MKKINLLSTFLILTLLLTANSSFAKSFKFAAVSDVHFSAKGNTDAKKSLNGLTARINENDYKFVVFLGDNIEKSKQENLTGFLNITKKIKTPYYLVLGDRDAYRISGIDKKNYITQVAKVNRNQPKDSSSFYFYPSAGIVAIVIDNVSSGLPNTHGIFSQKTLLWLDDVLYKNKNKKAIIFMHVPYITPCDRESHEILAPSDFRAIMVRHDNISAIVSGHYHKEYTLKDKQIIKHISVPALYEAPYNYEEIRVDYQKPFLRKAKNIEIISTSKPAI